MGLNAGSPSWGSPRSGRLSGFFRQGDKGAGYRSDVDGLRGLAILSVVAFHAGLGHVSGGFIGVDVFFVISGYLISSHIYRDLRADTFTLRRFYERRAKRILPAFLAVVLACYAFGGVLLAPRELERLAIEAASALTSTSNLHFWMHSNYFAKAADTQPLLMTWSLAVEEQFYLLFPLLLLACKRAKHGTVLWVVAGVSLLSFAFAVFQVSRYPVAAFFLLPSRWWELGCGTLLGIAETAVQKPHQQAAWQRESLALLGLCLLLWPVFTYQSSTRFPGAAALPPVLATLCLIRARGSWINRRLLSFGPLVFVGLVSYSWYLWHWPLLSFLHCLTGGALPVQSAAAAVLFAFLLAVLSYTWIETPFRRSKASAGLLPRYAFACACVIFPAGLLHLLHGWPARYPKAAAIEMTATSPDPGLCLRQGADLGHLPQVCRPDTDVAPTLAVLGDSHASAIARYLRTAAADHGWSLTEYTKASCPQLGSVARASFNNSRDAADCLAFNQAALRSVLLDTRVRKVVLAGFWSAPFGGTQNQGRYVLPGQDPLHVTSAESWDNFSRGLAGVVQLLEQHGKTVALATDVPRYDFDPLLIKLTDAIPLRRSLAIAAGNGALLSTEAAAVWEERDLRANAIVRATTLASGAQLLDLPPSLCHRSTCRYALGDELLYMDFNHLSAAGVRVALGNATVFDAPGVSLPAQTADGHRAAAHRIKPA